MGKTHKILITGGAGFIGSNFIDYYFKNKNRGELICIDKLTYAGKLDNIEKFLERDNFKFYKEDICNKNAMHQIIRNEKPDIIINFAAESHVDRSIDCSSAFYNSNVAGTINLMDCALVNSVKRFHQVSTDEVYGDLGKLNKNLRFNETSKIKPSNPYSASKASADLFVLSYARTHGLPITISRCSNNYGPKQHTEKYIPKIITNILQNKKIPIYGNGENIRDWIHVSDHCEALYRIITDGEIGSIYNIGADNEISNLEIAKIICEIFNYGDYHIHFVNDRKGHDYRYGIDATKIKKQLNWKAQTQFKEGIKSTVEWYVKNEQWWRKRIGDNV